VIETAFAPEPDTKPTASSGGYIMPENKQRDIARADLTGLGATSFCGGVFLMTAINYFIRGELVAWIYAMAVIATLGAAFAIGRRTLRRLSELS
jgi:hypothetical protein